MASRLPPLTALRAFEAAARHLSFAQAADELSVTPAALSFQIKSLEENLGSALFRRLNRAVELTEAGHALLPGCKEGFANLSMAWNAVQRSLDGRGLTITAGPAFTAKWLAPRLFQFAQEHPEIELRFSASLRLVDLDRDEVDVAIRFGYGPDKDLWSLPLAEEWVTPVMTPALAQEFRTPSDLVNAVLITDQSIEFLEPKCDWDAWFRTVGLDPVEAHGPKFSQADHAVDAALAGVGVTLARRALVVKDIMEGRLVAPFSVALKTGARFRFVCRQGTENKPQIKAFRDWMLFEIDKGQEVTASLELRDPLQSR